MDYREAVEQRITQSGGELVEIHLAYMNSEVAEGAVVWSRPDAIMHGRTEWVINEWSWRHQTNDPPSFLAYLPVLFGDHEAGLRAALHHFRERVERMSHYDWAEITSS